MPAKKVSKKSAAKEKTAKKSTAGKKNTTIVVTFDVGMGNDLALRGDGPGLSWDRGTTMRNIDAQTWQWKSITARKAFEVKFLVNDTIWSQGEHFVIKPGTTSGFAPSF